MKSTRSGISRSDSAPLSTTDISAIIAELYAPPEPQRADEFTQLDAAKVWRCSTRCAGVRLLDLENSGKITKREGKSARGRLMYLYRRVAA